MEECDNLGAVLSRMLGFKCLMFATPSLGVSNICFTDFLAPDVSLSRKEFVPSLSATRKKSHMTNIGGENSRRKPGRPLEPRQDFGFQPHLGGVQD
ncbi:hypothetical protein Tco_1368209 [Tanacetum coccineum]